MIRCPFFEGRAFATSPVQFVGEINSIHLLGQGHNPCPSFLLWFQSLCPLSAPATVQNLICGELYALSQGIVSEVLPLFRLQFYQDSSYTSHVPGPWPLAFRIGCGA